MFVPPNWIGLGIFGLLGVLNPGFWAIGLGLELAYLWILGTNFRFQRFASEDLRLQTGRQWQKRVDALVQHLTTEDQQKYRTLEGRCRELLEQQLRIQTSSAGIQAQGEGFSRLLWVYLRLLSTRQIIKRIIWSPAGAQDESAELTARIDVLKSRVDEALSEDLKKSLTGQIEILQQRLEKRREAKQKLSFLDAELTRIQEQVELIREQAVLSEDPEMLSQRIDQITTTLGSTTQWIGEQQRIFGAIEDLTAEAPPLQLKIDE